MININDNNRDNLIASCLIEAANVLSNTNTEVLEEGAQAKAYKARKAKEKADTEMNDLNNAETRALNKESAITESNRNNLDRYKDAMNARNKYQSRLDSEFSKIMNSNGDIPAQKVANYNNARNTVIRKVEKDIKREKKKKVMGESVEEHLEFANLLLED